VSILGHTCYIAKASFIKSRYIRVAGNVRTGQPEPKSLSATEFILCKLPLDGWLVIPRANYRQAQFRLWQNEAASRWTGPWDLNMTLNAWHLIEGAVGSQQPAVSSRQTEGGAAA